jgi:flagellar basal-body rod modification protein FlgD
MDDFLKLFCTQLQYQDPTNPMESYELAAQLAQFSSVEQLTEANTNLVAIESYLASLNNTEMVNLIGKDVVGNAGGILVNDGTVTSPSYTLPASDSSSTYAVTVKIYDSSDTLQRTLSLTGQSAGTYSVDWDGLDSSGAAVSDGQYYCTVTAEDSNGTTSTLTATNTGTVYSFVMDSTSPYVVLDGEGGLQVPISNVYEITTDEDAAAA